MQKPFVFQCVMRCLQLFYLKDRIPFIYSSCVRCLSCRLHDCLSRRQTPSASTLFRKTVFIGHPRRAFWLTPRKSFGTMERGVAWSAPSCCLKMGRRSTLFCDLQWRRRLHDGEGHLEHGHPFEGVGMKRQSEIFQRTKEKQYPGGKKPPDSGKIRQPGGGFFEGVPSLFLCICPARHFILKAASSLPPAW